MAILGHPQVHLAIDVLHQGGSIVLVVHPPAQVNCFVVPPLNCAAMLGISCILQTMGIPC